MNVKKIVSEHYAHMVECVCYGKSGLNPDEISIECTDCNEVLISANKNDKDLYDKLRPHIGHIIFCHEEGGQHIIECEDCHQILFKE